MDLVAGAKRIVVISDHNDKHGGHKFRHACTLPLTGANVVDVLITDLAVFERADRRGAPFRLVELADGVTLDELRSRTGAHFVTE
jgi:3-oxoacid CoA-transferase subunit B